MFIGTPLVIGFIIVLGAGMLTYLDISNSIEE